MIFQQKLRSTRLQGATATGGTRLASLGRWSAPLLAAMLAAACAGQPTIPVVKASAAPGGTSGATSGGTSGGLVATPVASPGGLSFHGLSPEHAGLASSGGGAGSVGSGARAAAPAAAPTAVGATSVGASQDAAISKGAPPPGGGATGGAVSGNVYNGSYYFGDSYLLGDSQLALASITEASAAGANGGFQAARAIAAPVVKDWAADARLVDTHAMLGADGAAIAGNGQPQPGVYGGGGLASPENLGGWVLTYASESNKEIMTFYVAPQKTVVLRKRFASYEIPVDGVAIDSTDAIKRLTAAIQSKTTKSEEESSGKDYFLGWSFTAPSYANGPEGNGYHTEVVYAVSPKAQWNITLREILGKEVWDLSYYAYENNGGGPIAVSVNPSVGVADAPQPKPTTDPGFYLNDSAQGMIDARTGAVIRFTRPTKNYYPVNPQASESPEKTPEPSQTPAPAPTPSASAAPSANPSASASAVAASPSPSASAAASTAP